MKKHYVSSLLNKSLNYKQEKLYIKYSLLFGNEREAQTFIMIHDLYDMGLDEEKMKLMFCDFSSRIAHLKEEGMRMLLSPTLTTYDKKILSLYSLVCADRLFLEFMEEVYARDRERGYLKKKEITDFFHTKALKSKDLSKWNVTTFRTLSCKYISLLLETELLIKRNKFEYIITTTQIASNLKELLNGRGVEGETYADIVDFDIREELKEEVQRMKAENIQEKDLDE